jgi:bile acid:Na+ symporter, BASS family
MNTIVIITQGMFFVLGMVMFGLGLSLTINDFRQIVKYPMPIFVALVLQISLLPLICYGMVVFIGLPPPFAVGLMLLAATPGGVAANLFSHLFGGNVAINISLTAISTVLSIVTLPLLTNVAIREFSSGSVRYVPIDPSHALEIAGIVLVPVIIGMLTHHLLPNFARSVAKRVGVFSTMVLIAFTIGAFVAGWDALVNSFTVIFPAVIAFNFASLFSGYLVSRAFGIDNSSAIAISFEVGIHNATFAMFIAFNVLKDIQVALPIGVYSATMYITATLFGLFVSRRLGRRIVRKKPTLIPDANEASRRVQ